MAKLEYRGSVWGIELKDAGPPSSLPALKDMPSSKPAEMAKTLKSQAEYMARFQALQQEENAKIMSSLCFLTESITDQDLESTD